MEWHEEKIIYITQGEKDTLKEASDILLRLYEKIFDIDPDLALNDNGFIINAKTYVDMVVNGNIMKLILVLLSEGINRKCFKDDSAGIPIFDATKCEEILGTLQLKTFRIY